MEQAGKKFCTEIAQDFIARECEGWVSFLGGSTSKLGGVQTTPWLRVGPKWLACCNSLHCFAHWNSPLCPSLLPASPKMAQNSFCPSLRWPNSPLLEGARDGPADGSGSPLYGWQMPAPTASSRGDAGLDEIGIDSAAVSDVLDSPLVDLVSGSHVLSYPENRHPVTLLCSFISPPVFFFLFHFFWFALFLFILFSDVLFRVQGFP